jgi:hypothetical protein
MSVRLRPSPSSLRSVNGQHAPFVRPRCGFDSCRGLLLTLVAQRKSAALRRQRTLVRLQPGVPKRHVQGLSLDVAREAVPWGQPCGAKRNGMRKTGGQSPPSVPGTVPGVEHRGRSSVGRAPERHSGEARSTRVVRFANPWCKWEHSELQPRGSGFESWRVCLDRDRDRSHRQRQRGADMHRHLTLVPARHAPLPRPAKVIALETRRKARLETKRPTPRPPRAAA